jgi:hypothetical protein
LTSNNDETEKVMNLWERAKPFDECKESLRRYISKMVDMQVYQSLSRVIYTYSI